VPWFNADSKMYLHKKCRNAGLAAMGLWLMCGTYSSDNLLDGHVPDWYVASWPQGSKLAKKLVEVRFWDEAEDGYQIRSWAEYQRTKEQVLAAMTEETEKRRRGGIQRSHDRWHVKRGVINPNCPLCPIPDS
jgi:hypothetical protein